MRWLASFIAWALIASAADVCPASAQDSGRVYRVGWLELGGPDWRQVPMEKWTGRRGVAFRDALRDSGFILGKNLVVDYRLAYGDVTRLATEAESLVASNVDVIVTPGTPPTMAAMKATRPVPIVFVRVGDPVEKGMIASLARPGGNATGMAVLITSAKLWQYLRDVSPATRRVAVVWYGQIRVANDRQAAYEAFVEKRKTEQAAAAGLEAFDMPLNTLDDAGSKLTEFAGGGDGGLYIVPDSTMQVWRPSILNMAIKNRLVSGCLQDREWAVAGCLVTYTEDDVAIFRGAAAMVAKVLRGTKPADIPVEEPSSFKLIINAKTAKALDLTVPPALLAAADEVIE